MAIEFYYVVGWDSRSGVWFTTDKDTAEGGALYDSGNDEWFDIPVGDRMLRALDNSAFAALSKALDGLNAAGLPSVGDSVWKSAEVAE